MIKLKGKYGNAKIFTNNLDKEVILDIESILNDPISENSNMAIMPDVHKGKSFPIGTTMKITNKVNPNGVSVDIGCGLLCQTLKDSNIDFQKLDNIIHKNIPSGFKCHTTPHQFANDIDLNELICVKHINLNRAYLSIGTLGGGNHYIEVDKDDDGVNYLVIHSGSRNLGKQIADHYQQLAYDSMSNSVTIKSLIDTLKAEGRDKEIESELKKFKSIKNEKVKKHMAYCTGQLMENYLHDMAIAQKYASLNRKAMANIIKDYMNWEIESEFETIHNYIEISSMILRKGAVSAKYGEVLIIALNMKDGSLICVGKGNKDYNFSCAHGCGRIMSRSASKEIISMTDYKESMKDIFTTSVNESTIDEAPMAYKPMQEIIDNIVDTVDIIKLIKPIYNYKDSTKNNKKWIK